MERFFEVAPGMAICNALAGDRHYDGLQAPDGADISTRAKHQRYMKERGVTMASDYTKEWATAADDRKKILAGDDKSRALDVAQAVERLSST